MHAGSPYYLDKSQLEAGYNALPEVGHASGISSLRHRFTLRDGNLQDQRALLQRVAGRIRTFAEAQRASIQDVDVAVPGGRAGQTVSPVKTAGCYAPGGRYPLPSSVLMTAITARVAGVHTVIVASPRPAAITIGAAFVAGADALLTVGGAQAIAALAYGTESIAYPF
jgi:histidinol dehydrogenase